jgi:phosphate transport system permease protein
MTKIQWRKQKNIIAQILTGCTALIGVFWLVYILGDVFIQGFRSLNIELFLADPLPPGVQGGGLRNAFVGQVMITLTAGLCGVPIGILAGTFLAEYGRYSRISGFISALADILISVPSIVIGIFVYTILVKPVEHFSGWSGAVALAIIMIPVITRTTQEILMLVDNRLREAAFALGATQHTVILQVIYPAAASGIMTGILLGIARVGGETAPLLFTAFNNAFFSTDMSRPMATLTTSIYQYSTGPYAEWHSQAWAASLVICVFSLILNILGRYIIYTRYKKSGV